MNVVLQPWQLLFAILSDWVNERQQEIIRVSERRDHFPHAGPGEETHSAD